MESESPGKRVNSTTISGNWAGEIDRLITAVSHINQLEEVEFCLLYMLAGHIV